MSDQPRAWSECIVCAGSGLMLVHPGPQHVPLSGIGIDPCGLLRIPCSLCAAHWGDVDAAVADARGEVLLRAAAVEEAAVIRAMAKVYDAADAVGVVEGTPEPETWITLNLPRDVWAVIEGAWERVKKERSGA